MIDILRTYGTTTFASFYNRNYRLYFIGQGISDIGTWMQIVAVGWLVLELSGSGTLLGVVLAFRFAPLLALSVLAGNIVDSFDKRLLLYVTQAAAALISLALGILVFSGHIELWMIYGAALLLGLADVVDRPTRQAFVHEIVGPENLRNAVSLGSTRANLARTVGPLCAGLVIAATGVAACLFVNVLSYAVSIVFLTRMRKEDLKREPRSESPVSHVFAGIWYVASAPLLRTILIVMAVIGTLTYEFQITLPLLAHTTFAGSAADYAALLSAMGVGSIAGGLFSASRKEVGLHEFVFWAFLFGTTICLAAISPTLGFATVGMIFIGFCSICLSSTANTMIQLESAPHMRGRVMALWTMALFGSTLIGAPLVGMIGEYISPRAALGLGGVAAILSALYAMHRLLPNYRLLSIPLFVSIKREETSEGIETKL